MKKGRISKCENANQAKLHASLTADVIYLYDDYGEIYKTHKIPIGRSGFEGADLSGIVISGDQLQSANCKDAELYWAILFMANLDGANFENANLQGADLKKASCVRTNFRNANIGRDLLGGSAKLQGSDLTDAVLNDANMKGVEFDQYTKFPKGFYPDLHGMVYKNCDDNHQI